MRYRVRVEVEYFLHLSEIPLPQLAQFKADDAEPLRRIYTEFSEADAERIKAFERTTNHDVKAVEYFIKEKMEALGLAEMAEFIHFGLTSQDVNNTAIPLSIKEATEQVIVPGLKDLRKTLLQQAREWKASPCLLVRTASRHHR